MEAVKNNRNLSLLTLIFILIFAFLQCAENVNIEAETKKVEKTLHDFFFAVSEHEYQSMQDFVRVIYQTNGINR